MRSRSRVETLANLHGWRHSTYGVAARSVHGGWRYTSCTALPICQLIPWWSIHRSVCASVTTTRLIRFCFAVLQRVRVMSLSCARSEFPCCKAFFHPGSWWTETTHTSRTPLSCSPCLRISIRFKLPNFIGDESLTNLGVKIVRIWRQQSIKVLCMYTTYLSVNLTRPFHQARLGTTALPTLTSSRTDSSVTSITKSVQTHPHRENQIQTEFMPRAIRKISRTNETGLTIGTR